MLDGNLEDSGSGRAISALERRFSHLSGSLDSLGSEICGKRVFRTGSRTESKISKRRISNVDLVTEMTDDDRTARISAEPKDGSNRGRNRADVNNLR